MDRGEAEVVHGSSGQAPELDLKSSARPFRGSAMLLFVLLATLVLCTLVYLPVTRTRLFADDFIFIYEASRVESPRDMVDVGYSSRGRLPRPATIAYFWVGWHLWGLDPVPWHLCGLVLHLITALLLACWVRGVSGSAVAAGLAALVFLLYPAHFEVVLWPAAVGKILGGMLTLTCLLAFARWRQRGDGSAFAAMLVALVAALLTEESAIALPLLLALADRMLYPQPAPRVWLARHATAVITTLALAAAAVAVTVSHRGGLDFSLLADGVQNEVAGMITTLVGGRALEWLASHGFLPLLSPLGAWLGLGMYAGLCGVLAGRVKTALSSTPPPALPAVAFHLSWIAVAWLPYAFFVPHSFSVERYTYIPSLGLAGLVACLWTACRPRVRPLFLAVVVLGALAGGASLAASVGAIAEVRRLPQTEPASIASALRNLGPNATAYVYSPPLWAHFPSRAVGLYGKLPPQRLRDWYDAIRSGKLQPGDVLVFHDAVTGEYRDLTDAVRPFLAREAPSESKAAQDDGAADRVVKSWDLTRETAPWVPVRLEALDGGGWRTAGVDGALVLPALDARPTDLYRVRVRLRLLHASSSSPHLALGWATDRGDGYGPLRTVLTSLRPTPLEQTVELCPATMPAWWTEGRIRRLYLIPCDGAADVAIERIELLEFPPRHNLR